HRGVAAVERPLADVVGAADLGLGEVELPGVAGEAGILRLQLPHLVLVRTHRSISPSTMSSEALTAITSESSAPSIMCGSAAMLMNEGPRTRQRTGFAPPSEPTYIPSSPLELSTENQDSPTGARTPSMTSLKWWIMDSMSFIAADFGGRMTRGSSTLIGPPGSRSMACCRMRRLCRISSIRQR